jgi:hypothetical protein
MTRSSSFIIHHSPFALLAVALALVCATGPCGTGLSAGPVRVGVPFPPGDSVDAMGRRVGRN